MVSSKTTPSRPATGGLARKRANAPREHHLPTDVTKEEKRAILQHCLQNKISVSQFLGELALADAKRAADLKTANAEEEQFTITFQIPRSQYMKLSLLARLQEKSLEQLMQDLIQPSIATRQPPGSLETETIRYYLSKQEHEIVTKHIAKQGMSARNYVALLAMEAISSNRKTRK